MRALFLVLVATLGCAKSNPEPDPIPLTQIPGHDGLPQDLSSKEQPRLMPAEAYVRSYLRFFGGLAPMAAEAALRGTDAALFSTWGDYLVAIGLPQYRDEVRRRTSTNAMMLATFERLGIALCTRALEHDLHDPARPPVEKRLVFAFEPTVGDPTLDEFATRFDVLHRTFLGYPAYLAPEGRAKRYFDLYNGVVARHRAKDAPASLLTPAEAGWSAVCSGLLRHPEFGTY